MYPLATALLVCFCTFDYFRYVLWVDHVVVPFYVCVCPCYHRGHLHPYSYSLFLSLPSFFNTEFHKPQFLFICSWTPSLFLWNMFLYIPVFKSSVWTGEMTQQIKTLAALPKDLLEIVPDPHTSSQLSVTLVPRDLDPFLASLSIRHTHGSQT